MAKKMKAVSFKRFLSALSLTLALVLTSLFSIPAAVSAADAYGRFEGSGTAADPFLISTPAKLMELRDITNSLGSASAEFKSYQSAYFKLTNDINMAGYDWHYPMFPDNAKHFSGDFDGSGFAILNLSKNTLHGSAMGLFGFVSGKVHDLTLKGIALLGDGTVGMGGITGVLRAKGAIDNCTVTGTLTATQFASSNIGGIVGVVSGSFATISHCVFNGDIVLTNDFIYDIGGILGYVAEGALGTTVSDCYSAGSITRPGIGSHTIGKILGGAYNPQVLNATDVINCTTSMVVNAECHPNFTMGEAGHNGTEVTSSTDLNTYNIVRSNDSANKVAVFNIKGDFQAAKVNLVEIVLSYDATNYDVTAVNVVNGATVESVRVENGTVKLLIGVTNLDTIANNGEETIAVVTVTPKTGKTPAQAEISITSFKGWEVLNDGVTVAEVELSATATTATSPFNYTVPGDANNDGVVTAADLSLVLYYFGYTADQLPAGINVDVNGDGIVTMADVTIIVNLIF